MPDIIVLLINAFTDNGTGGNPAGVVLNADRLDAAAKQQIAAKVGVSETAFVSSSDTADFKLEFFTPTQQIAHCGHATVATFSYLARNGYITGSRSSKETIDGNRDIFLSGDIAYMEQTAPIYEKLDKPNVGIQAREVLTSLGLKRPDLIEEQEPIVVNTGNSFLIVPLKNEQVLKNLNPDWEAIEKISDTLDLIGYYPFTLEAQISGRDAAARMFAPRYGIREEAATGMAVGPLACFLYDQLGIRKPKMVIEQGRLMSPPSPSELLVELMLEDGRIMRLIAGGRAKVMKQVKVTFS